MRNVECFRNWSKPQCVRRSYNTSFDMCVAAVSESRGVQKKEGIGGHSTRFCTRLAHLQRPRSITRPKRYLSRGKRVSGEKETYVGTYVRKIRCFIPVVQIRKVQQVDQNKRVSFFLSLFGICIYVATQISTIFHAYCRITFFIFPRNA